MPLLGLRKESESDKLKRQINEWYAREKEAYTPPKLDPKKPSKNSDPLVGNTKPTGGRVARRRGAYCKDNDINDCKVFLDWTQREKQGGRCGGCTRIAAEKSTESTVRSEAALEEEKNRKPVWIKDQNRMSNEPRLVQRKNDPSNVLYPDRNRAAPNLSRCPECKRMSNNCACNMGPSVSCINRNLGQEETGGWKAQNAEAAGRRKMSCDNSVPYKDYVKYGGKCLRCFTEDITARNQKRADDLELGKAYTYKRHDRKSKPHKSKAMERLARFKYNKQNKDVNIDINPPTKPSRRSNRVDLYEPVLGDGDEEMIKMLVKSILRGHPEDNSFLTGGFDENGRHRLCGGCGQIGYPCQYIAGGYCESGHVAPCGPSRMGEHCTFHDGPAAADGGCDCHTRM